MSARKIATSVPAGQFEALERVRKRLRLGRSQAVQEALSLWLEARAGDARVRQYMRGYMARPDDPAEAAALARAWATGLEAEDW